MITILTVPSQAPGCSRLPVLTFTLSLGLACDKKTTLRPLKLSCLVDFPTSLREPPFQSSAACLCGLWPWPFLSEFPF